MGWRRRLLRQLRDTGESVPTTDERGATQALPETVPVPERRPTTPTLDAAAAEIAAPATEVAGADTATVTPAAPVDFVDMSRTEKLDHVAGLMKAEQPTLDQNEVSPHIEAKLGAAMLNESAHNQRRMNVGNDFQTLGNKLHDTLEGVDLAAVSADPKAFAKLTKGMNGDTRWLLAKVQAGTLDLSALDGDDAAKQAALKEQLTGLGIDRRVEQYTAMSDLLAKKAAGPLSKEEKATLAGLQKQRGLGMGANLGELEGMTPERFRGIYDEGNQRFEPAQYTSLRDSYRRNKSAKDTQQLAHDARPNKVDAPAANVTASAGIGSFQMDPTAQTALGTNMDLIADMATSWGGGQIMGAYAQAGLMTAKQADGTDHTVTLDELKASATRLTPQGDDVFQQLGFMNMKGIELDNTTMSNGTFTTMYNGSQPGSELYNDYRSKLNQNVPAYEATRQRLG